LSDLLGATLKRTVYRTVYAVRGIRISRKLIGHWARHYALYGD